MSINTIHEEIPKYDSNNKTTVTKNSRKTMGNIPDELLVEILVALPRQNLYLNYRNINRRFLTEVKRLIAKQGATITLKDDNLNQNISTLVKSEGVCYKVTHLELDINWEVIGEQGVSDLINLTNKCTYLKKLHINHLRTKCDSAIMFLSTVIEQCKELESVLVQSSNSLECTEIVKLTGMPNIKQT